LRFVCGVLLRFKVAQKHGGRSVPQSFMAVPMCWEQAGHLILVLMQLRSCAGVLKKLVRFYVLRLLSPFGDEEVIAVGPRKEMATRHLFFNLLGPH